MSEMIPRGFQFAGVYSGVKRDLGKKDLAILVSDQDATGVGVFTTNQLCAAPVQLCRRRLPSDSLRAVAINSGNANACTGDQGLADAETMAKTVAGHLGCRVEQVLVCSTGVIGQTLPMAKITKGLADACQHLNRSRASLESAAVAILTTDTRIKLTTREIVLPGGAVRIVGIAKGAAMIGPNMATMLAVILTDAAVPASLLGPILGRAVDVSFHCLSVEGHTSTNDSVIALANGASGVAVPEANSTAFASGVEAVCRELARSIADDAEGASHLVTIEVTGTRDDAEARKIARCVANSPLVKTAIYGNDPNWGRICSAAGYAGVEFSEPDLSLRLNGTLLYDRGRPTDFDVDDESQRLRKNRETHIELLFSLGTGRSHFWTCDLTTEYVSLNADYTT